MSALLNQYAQETDDSSYVCKNEESEDEEDTVSSIGSVDSAELAALLADGSYSESSGDELPGAVLSTLSPAGKGRNLKSGRVLNQLPPLPTSVKPSRKSGARQPEIPAVKGPLGANDVRMAGSSTSSASLD